MKFHLAVILPLIFAACAVKSAPDTGIIFYKQSFAGFFRESGCAGALKDRGINYCYSELASPEMAGETIFHMIDEGCRRIIIFARFFDPSEFIPPDSSVRFLVFDREVKNDGVTCCVFDRRDFFICAKFVSSELALSLPAAFVLDDRDADILRGCVAPQNQRPSLSPALREAGLFEIYGRGAAEDYCGGFDAAARASDFRVIIHSGKDSSRGVLDYCAANSKISISVMNDLPVDAVNRASLREDYRNALLAALDRAETGGQNEVLLLGRKNGAVRIDYDKSVNHGVREKISQGMKIL